MTDKISSDTDLLKGGVKPNRNGRPKGAVNRFTSLKQAFLDAFQATGGAKGLAEWVAKSERNRATFYALITKLFPQEVAHSGELSHVLKFEFGENGNGKEGHE